MHPISRRHFLAGSGAGAILCSLGGPAWAQAFPTKPLELVVGFSPGGGFDTYARAAAAALPPFLNGQSAVVLNQPGAAGVIALEQPMAGPSDGHTVSVTSAGSTIIKKLWDGNGPVLSEDLKPVCTIGKLTSCVVVRKDEPFANAQEWIAHLKGLSRPVRWANPGRGSAHSVAAQALLNSAGVQSRDVPFEGASEARTALINGEVDFSAFGVQNVTGFEDRIRPMGVFSNEREPAMPDVPTFLEQGFSGSVIFTPAVIHVNKATSDETVAALENIFKQAVATDAYKEFTAAANLPVYFRSSEETQEWTETVIREWAPIVAAIKQGGQ